MVLTVEGGAVDALSLIRRQITAMLEHTGWRRAALRRRRDARVTATDTTDVLSRQALDYARAVHAGRLDSGDFHRGSGPAPRRL